MALGDMTLFELVPRVATKATAKAKGHAKATISAQREGWHVDLDRIIEYQQSEMYSDALIQEKKANTAAEQQVKEAHQ